MDRAKNSEIPSFVLYGESPGETEDRLLHVETIAARGRPHNWKIRPHVHRDLHQVLFITRGRGVARTESATKAFRPPALILVPAGSVHAFDFEPGTQGFVASLADDLLRDIGRSDPGIRSLFDSPALLELSAPAARATDLQRAFQMMAREFLRLAPGRRAALEALLLLILANALRLSHTLQDPGEESVGRERLLVARFRELIESEFRRNTPLAGYAAGLSVSPSRLRRACLMVAGQSPMRLVHARQMLEAKRQLLYTNMSVAEIAYALGFEDCAYFTRFFSRRAGISPRGFRQRQSGA